MFLKNIFKRENKAPKFLRQTNNDERTWMPLAKLWQQGSATSDLQSSYVSRALQVIYSDLPHNVCPLKADTRR